MRDEDKTKKELINELKELRRKNADLEIKNKELKEEIAKLREAEENLVTDEQRIRTIIDNAEEVIYMLSWNGDFIFVSPAWTHIIGHPVSEVIGRNFVPFVHPEDVEACFNFLNLVYTSGMTQRGVEYRVKTTDGKWVWFTSTGAAIKDKQGNLLYYVGVALNITERKRNEEELRFKNLILSTQQETSIDGILVVGQKGNILSYNQRFASIWGIPSEILETKSDELALKSILDKLLDPEEFITKVNYLYENKDETSFDEINLRDGRIFERYSASMIGNDGIYYGRVWYFRDITSRRHIEIKLEKESTTLRNFIELNPYSIQILDKNGFTLKVNRAHTHLFSAVPPKDYTVLNDLILQRNGLQDEMKRVINGEVVYFPEFHYNASEIRSEFPNKPIWIRMVAFPIFSHDGKVENIALMHENISERKLAEEKLRIFQESVESSSDAIGMSTPEGKHYYENRAFKDLFGELKENHPKTLYVDKNTGIEVFKTIMSGKQWSGEVEMYSKDGTILNIFLRAYASKTTDCRITNLIGIHTDITKWKAAEKEREKMQGQLLQMQKMEAVGRLAGGIAHDFNNMLVVIFCNVEMAMEDIKQDHPAYAALEEIQKAAQRSAKLTKQLLAFARRETANPIIINLNETIEEMLKMLRRLIGEDVKLQWKPFPDLWLIKMDPSQIDQILANLCVNARDAISDIGKITIETGNITFNDIYCTTHNEFTPGNYVMLAVSDNGCGIDKDILEHIFEPFFTTKKMGKGTGLGLATVYGIVRQNDGFINVYSETRRGTTFKIYLPALSDNSSKIIDNTTFELSGEIGGKTLLLVEDEPAILKIIKAMLETMGYKILAANNPVEAVKIAEEYEGEIHLLITDVIMPEMNGRELARRLNFLYPKIKHLFMSGYTADVIAHHGVLDEGVNFIQKPFSKIDLADKIRKSLER